MFSSGSNTQLSCVSILGNSVVLLIAPWNSINVLSFLLGLDVWGWGHHIAWVFLLSPCLAQLTLFSNNNYNNNNNEEDPEKTHMANKTIYFRGNYYIQIIINKRCNYCIQILYWKFKFSRRHFYLLWYFNFFGWVFNF